MVAQKKLGKYDLIPVDSQGGWYNWRVTLDQGVTEVGILSKNSPDLDYYFYPNTTRNNGFSADELKQFVNFIHEER